MVKKWINIKSLKEVVLATKSDIPKLLGYEDVNLYISSKTQESLYIANVSDKDDQLKKYSFEQDYTFDPMQVIHFPTKVGISGFCFFGDAINYCNTPVDNDASLKTMSYIYAAKDQKV